MATYLDVGSYVVSESDGYVDVTFALKGDVPSVATSVYYYTNYSYASASYGSDFQYVGNTQLTFAAGETSKVVRFNLIDDATQEPTESFFINFSSPSGLTLTKDFANITIIDNDAPTGVPSISVSDVVVDESSGLANFVVTLDKPSTGEVSVRYATAAGSAIAGNDFTSTGNILTFAAGQTAQTVSVAIRQDVVAEGNEFFKLVLSNPGNATIADGVGVARIGASDNPVASLPTIRVADTTVGEGDGYVDVVFSLSAPSAQQVSVNYYTNYSYATASYGSDFAYYGTTTLTFQPGQTTATVRLDIHDDNATENLEDFFITLNTPVNAVMERDFATITIVDNDGTSGTPGISISDAQVDEKAGVATFVVTLDKPAAGQVSVSYATGGGTATANADYSSAAEKLVFRAGEVSKTVTVAITDDAIAEKAELFNVTLSGAVGGTIVDKIGVGRIAANDGPTASLPVVSAGAVIASEGDSHATLTFSLSAPSNQQVSLTWYTDYSHAGATASYGSDYAYFGSDTVIFAPGETSKTIDITLDNDTTAESTEQFYVKLYSAVNATITSPDVIVTIVDDDGGNKILHGGIGDDSFVVTKTTDQVIESENGGTDTVTANVNWTLGDYIENLRGGAAANTLTGNALDNKLYGFAGNDKLYGLTGTDILDGGKGADFMDGGSGNDTYYVDNASDYVSELASGGIDTIITAVNYELAFNVEIGKFQSATANVNLTGNDLSNTFYSNQGNNVLDGAFGSDTVSYELATKGVTVDLSVTTAQNTGWGSDTLISIERLTGTKFADVLIGNAAGNLIKSGAGNDTIKGGGGRDNLYGLAGNDKLYGGSGNDSLAGGAGADKFYFDVKPNATNNVDLITDFHAGQDSIYLDNAYFKGIGTEGKVITAGAFKVGTAATDASDRIIYDINSGDLYYDADGTGAKEAVLFATLKNAPVVSYSDFFVS